MQIVPKLAKSLTGPLIVALVVLTASTAWGLGQQCVGCQTAPDAAPVMVRVHVPARSLFVAPVAAPRPLPARPPASLRAPTRLPRIDTVPNAPAGSVRARVLATWPGDDTWADRTVACESDYNPSEVGGGGNNYFGLFQMGPWARGIYGNPLGQSVEQQTLAAWRLLKDEGSSQWACSPYSYHP